MNIVALAIYLRFTHAISYRRLSRLFLHLFALPISEGALDALFRRAKPRFDDEVAAILARLRRSRIICSDETTVRIDGRTCWNWVFQNDEVVIHVVRQSRPAVVAEVLAGTGRRSGSPTSTAPSKDMPTCGRSAWRTNCATAYAIEAGDAIFAPRMKALLLRAVVLASSPSWLPWRSVEQPRSGRGHTPSRLIPPATPRVRLHGVARRSCGGLDQAAAQR